VDRLIREVEEVRKEAGIREPLAGAMGVAVPGLIDRKKNALTRSVNLPVLEGYPIAEQLARRSGLSVTLATDAEATAWAEYLAHPGRPARFAHLRLGTGVACGVVADGALLDIYSERSGHLDVLVVESGPGAPECSCGRQGCLEAIASGAALLKHGGAFGYPADLDSLQRAWQRGEATARKIIGDAAAGVSTAVGKIAQRFGAEVVCIGGGVVDRLPALFNEAAACFRKSRTSGDCDFRTSIELSRLGDGAGVIGGALLAFAQLERVQAR
jgi:glucokinase